MNFHCKCSRQQRRRRTFHSKVVGLVMSFTKITTTPFGLLDYRKTTTRQRTRNQKVSIEFINLLSMSFSTVLSKHEKVKSLSFHEIMGPVILIGNAFSIFPVTGIFSRSADNLKFRIFSPITIYAIVVQFASCSSWCFCSFFYRRQG